MLNDPLIRYELVKAQQREIWRDAELARHARAASPDQAGLVEQREAAPDLVERVLQHVWKRLGLPAREPGSRPDHGWSGFPSGKKRPAHPADGSLFELH